MNNKRVIKLLFIVLLCIFFCEIFKRFYKSKNNEENSIIDNNSKKRDETNNDIKNVNRGVDESTNKNEEEEKDFIYNSCLDNYVPKVSGLLETAQYLRFTNCSLIRFGDSEIRLMLKENDDKQLADEKLSQRLIESFKSKDPNIAIAIPNVFSNFPGYVKRNYKLWLNKIKHYTQWMINNSDYNRQYFDAFISSPFTATFGTSCERVSLVYDNLREIWRDKDIVILRGDNGEEYEYDVYDSAKKKKILFAPPTNAWKEYDEIKKMLMKEDSNNLFIIAIGASSEMLVVDLTKEGRRALDLGHLAKDYNNYKKNVFQSDFYKI